MIPRKFLRGRLQIGIKSLEWITVADMFDQLELGCLNGNYYQWAGSYSLVHRGTGDGSMEYMDVEGYPGV